MMTTQIVPSLVTRFEHAVLPILTHGMQIVRSFQMDERSIGAASVKADQTLLTRADKECGEALVSLLEHNLPGVPNSIEDATEVAGSSRFTIYGDPIDGTRAFTVGLPTSTVILGLYDTEEDRMWSCAIGEPISGRVWFCRDGRSFIARLERSTIMPEREITVWSGQLNTGATVLLDVGHGFARQGRQILTHEQAARLTAQLAQYKLFMPGSNGLNQAMVAMGNDFCAGGITTAIGGPQDVCGVQLVLNAGGVARAWAVAPERTLRAVDPRAIEQYDIVAYGNSLETVDQLSAFIHDLFLKAD